MHDNTNVSSAQETLKAAEKEDMNCNGRRPLVISSVSPLDSGQKR